MRFSWLLAAASAEMRTACRQTRTWLGIVLVLGFSLVVWINVNLDAPPPLPTLSSVPRFLIVEIGLPLTLMLLVSIVFLAFDVRGRDQRERIADVLDARPISNLELLCGRLVSVVALAWLPLALFALLAQTLGLLVGELVPETQVEPMEWQSLAAFLLLSALPLFVLWGSFVVLLAVLFRNRLAVALIALAAIGAWFWSIGSAPAHLISVVASQSLYASDVMPRFAEAQTLIHRAALLLVAGGLLVAAAAAHVRRDDGARPRRFAIAAALLAAGCGGIAVAVLAAVADVELRRHWLAAHQAAAVSDSMQGDIERLRGTVRIVPGERLAIDVDVLLRGADAESLVFSFNPGMTVEEVQIDGDADVRFRHQDGLLSVTLPARSSVEDAERIRLSLRASGIPDSRFGYLDSATDDVNPLILGTKASIFQHDYVALMPGAHWLPSRVEIGGPGRRDFFAVNLEVDVPAGWLVAGPGQRREAAARDGMRPATTRYRFHPEAPVPAVALLASRFERLAMTVADVELELLVHARHLDNVAYFADAVPELARRLDERFADAAGLGLGYPYGGLSMVETPAGLRTYGGGWRMDTVQSLPGIMLLDERSLPSARLQRHFQDPEQYADRDQDAAAAKVDALEHYFESDFTGGNPFQGVSRNFLPFQTGAVGEGMAAVALEFVVGELVNLLLTDRGGYFSAYVFSTGFGSDKNRWLLTSAVEGLSPGASVAALDAVANRPSVWDRALGTSLAKLDPQRDPSQALNVLSFKGRAVARSILDALGRQRTAALLAELRRHHVGGHFDWHDFNAAAQRIGVNLAALVGDWLHDEALPGFLASPATLVRLTDGPHGRPRYQTRLHIRNGEGTPGLLRLGYALDKRDVRRGNRRNSDPIRIDGHAAVEVGLVTAQPPIELWVQPYLSLNRRDVRLALPAVDAAGRHAGEPLAGVVPSAWRPRRDDAIVVDDLDPGFSVERDSAQNGLRLRGLGTVFLLPADMDQGLPEYSDFATTAQGTWTRQELPLSWGRYRHTVARAAAGDGLERAVFAAELPATGRWRLSYHLPPPPPSERESGFAFVQGDYDLRLEVGTGRRVRTVEFDAAAAEVGWNDLGAFDLPAGSVRLLVSNGTAGDLVLADAIRWRAENVAGLMAGDFPRPAQAP